MTSDARASKEGPSHVPPLVGAVVIIVFSLVSVGYGLYELVFSGIATGHAQERLEDEFAARKAGTAATTAVPATTTPPDTVVATDFEDPNDVPVLIASPAEGEGDVAPVIVPEVISEVGPDEGEAVGRMSIPSIGLDWVMVEGVAPDDLRRGPGHMMHTPLPGQPGNSVVSGHRTTSGAPFEDLDLLEEGDVIEIETLIGTHTYEVVGSLIVAPDDVWVTFQRGREGAWLTLTTCNPKFSSRERLIVFARLVAGPNEDAIHADGVPDYDLPQPPSA